MFVTDKKKKKSRAPHQHLKETVIRELERLERNQTGLTFITKGPGDKEGHVFA